LGGVGGVSSTVENGKHNQKAPEDVAFIREKTYTFIREKTYTLPITLERGLSLYPCRLEMRKHPLYPAVIGDNHNAGRVRPVLKRTPEKTKDAWPETKQRKSK
jgi:hypothetical protein